MKVNKKELINKSNSKMKVSNNMIIIFTSIILIGIIIIAVIIGNMGNSLYTLELNGEANVVVYKDGSYEDPGAKLYDENNNDLSEKIIVDNDVNLNKIGSYEIVYKYDDVYVKRIVKVVERPTNNASDNIVSNNNDDDDANGETTLELKGNKVVYIDINGNYKEDGFTAVDSVDGNIKSKVKVTHNIDNTKAGVYQIVYTVRNSSGITTSIKRDVVVMKVELNLSLVTKDYTNGNVGINVSVNDEYFNYVVLPNGTSITSKNYVYTVSENGTYKFVLYNKHGVVREKSITVNNIDRSIPSGNCSGSYKDGVSTIKVTATDNVGISKYVVNGKNYTTSTIKVNQELTQVNVNIYDKAGNQSIVSCVLEDKNETIRSDKSITFSYQFISDENLAYGLYTPSTVKTNKKTPLIIWLHGSGSVGASHDKFKNNFLSFMKNWELEGFNAYVLCPLLSSGTWNKQKTKTKVYTLIDMIISEKNIDTDKIILAGHSLGAQGIYNIADGKLDYYSALVFLSPYKQSPSSIDITQFKNIPLRGYVGTVEAGEDSLSYSHATKAFSNTFGKDKLIILNTRHGTVPNVAFTTDSNSDNKSDLIEWMLSQ